jgi:hypothetical protein
MLGLVAGVSTAGSDLAAADQESPTISPSRLAAAADIFVPGLGGADYVVTLRVQRGWGPPGSDTHVVTRRGDWVRVEIDGDGRATTRYLGLAHGMEVSLIRNPAGGYS